MKIKHDFVTNSSSTMFILIVDNKTFTFDNFLNSAGVQVGSALVPLFESLFRAIKGNMELFEDLEIRGRRDLSRIPEEIQSIIQSKQSEGKSVYIGDLYSDNNNFESFFCVDSFIIDNDEIYFNALECVW